MALCQIVSLDMGVAERSKSACPWTHDMTPPLSLSPNSATSSDRKDEPQSSPIYHSSTSAGPPDDHEDACSMSVRDSLSSANTSNKPNGSVTSATNSQHSRASTGRAFNSQIALYQDDGISETQSGLTQGRLTEITGKFGAVLRPVSPSSVPEGQVQDGSTKDFDCERSDAVSRSRYTAWNRNVLNLSLANDSNQLRQANPFRGHSLSLDERQYHQAQSRYTANSSSVSMINWNSLTYASEYSSNKLARPKSTPSVDRHSTGSESMEGERQRRGTFKWMASVKEWILLKEPSMEGMRQYRKTLWTRYGLKPGDPQSAARMRIPFGDIPRQATISRSGPVSEEFLKRKKQRDCNEFMARSGQCCSPGSSGLSSPSPPWTCKEKLATPWECEIDEDRQAACSSEGQSIRGK